MTYYPVLRNSASEMNAYFNLKEDTKDSIVPIIESKRISSKNKKTWWTSFKTLGTYLATKLQNREFIYDFKQAYDIIGDPEVELLTEDNQNIITYCSGKLIEQDLNFIPCFHYDSPNWYVESIKDQGLKKIAVRVRCNSFDSTLDPFIYKRIEDLLNTHFTMMEKIIIIIDFADKYQGYNRIKKAVETYSKLDNATILLALTSCPANSDGVPAASIKEASPRDDINTYFELLNDFPELHFADYTVRLAPEPEEGKNIDYYNTYLKIFYTTTDFYIIGKSTLLKDSGVESFVDVCKTIVESDFYSGKNFSAGDYAIYECSVGDLEITNHAKPIEIGINHHIEFVNDQVREKLVSPVFSSF
ncbi:beta family protein [Brevibacillus porteri]|uniref:beta family protein n=1 Tax=Brevibacillus porteri TaxID=2126350 RepID=UPI003D1B651A